MRLLLLAFCLSLPATLSEAIPPDRIDHYNLVPQHSTLLQTGGFAGVEQRYRLRGDYDFVQGWGDDWSSLTRSARFANADIRAPLGDLLPAFIDVDELLNLEGLRGELLPLGAPFDVYRFRGIINDGIPASPAESSRIDLFAALLGPWMYVYGETTPPPHTADYFEYELKMVARRGRWADWNEDGVVDAADYTLARDEDPAMVADWLDQYGSAGPDMETFAVLASAAASSATAVPEPATVLLLALAVTLVPRTRRSACRP